MTTPDETFYTFVFVVPVDLQEDPVAEFDAALAKFAIDPGDFLDVVRKVRYDPDVFSDLDWDHEFQHALTRALKETT